MATLSGLNSDERQRLIKESAIQETSLGEARKSKDFKLWRSSYRAELEKEKSPTPSTKQSISEAEKPWDTKTEKEKVEWIRGIRILNKKTGKYEQTKFLPRVFYQPKE